MTRLHYLPVVCILASAIAPGAVCAQEGSNPPIRVESLQVLSARGTGETIGQIGFLIVRNNTGRTLTVASATYYIPSDGRHQSYKAETPPGHAIPAGETDTIPVEGVCTDVGKPPVPSGSSMPDFDSWIGVGEPEVFQPGTDDAPVPLVPTTVVPPFSPTDIQDIQNTPGYQPYGTGQIPDVVTIFPDTDIPVGGTINPGENPATFAPLITGIVDDIESATPVIQSGGKHPTPFAGDPVREAEAIIQQTTWIVMGALTGNAYEKDDFASNVYTQFEDNTGVAVVTLPQEEKEKVDAGVDLFWNSFMATGAAAKVLSDDATADVVTDDPVTGPPSEDPPEDPPPPEEVPDTCTLTKEIDCEKEDLDYDIADTGTKEKNEKVREAFKKAVEELGNIASDAEGSDTVDVTFTTPEMPASAFSLWIPHAVFGRANATAFEIDNQNITESAMTTEPLSTEADGKCQWVWTHTLGKDCKSTLIGINMAKVRANSALSATLGSPEILEVVNLVGEIAIEFVTKRKGGSWKKISKFLKEKTKDLAKDKAKEVIKEELKKLAEQMKGKTEEEIENEMDKLLEEIKGGETGETAEEEAEDFLSDWLAERIVEGEEFDPEDKIKGDILDKIDSPIDWSPIQTHTYALAEGQLEVWVEGDHDIAKAASGVRYVREEFESKEEAEKGGGIFCEGALASATTSGQITLETMGVVTTMAGATGEGIVSTGHGRATATLESFNGMYIVAICECPDFISFEEGQSQVTFITNEEIMGPVWKKVFENIMHEAYQNAVESEIPIEDFQKALRNGAARAAATILRCE